MPDKLLYSQGASILTEECFIKHLCVSVCSSGHCSNKIALVELRFCLNSNVRQSIFGGFQGA